MPSVPVEHIAWSKARASLHRYSLADSAIATPDLRALGLPHAAEMPPEGYRAQAELERLIGERIGAPGGRVLLTAGASEANACALAALLSPGDEVLAERPGYEPHRAAARLFGAAVRAFDRPMGEGPGGAARPGALAEAVEQALGPGTRLVVLSDLHNPGGAALDEQDARVLDALAAQRGFRVLCDETFRDAGRLSCGTRAALSGRWLATASLTKVYGLGGLRIGWVAGDAATLAACETAQDALTVQPSLLSIALARALVPHLDALRARTHAILSANHAAFGRLAARQRHLAGPPVTGLTTWREFGVEGEGDRFAAFAGARFDLALARGGFFGRPRGVRVALGGEPAAFAAALEVLEAAAGAFDWAAEAGGSRVLESQRERA